MFLQVLEGEALSGEPGEVGEVGVVEVGVVVVVVGVRVRFPTVEVRVVDERGFVVRVRIPTAEVRVADEAGFGDGVVNFRLVDLGVVDARVAGVGVVLARMLEHEVIDLGLVDAGVAEHGDGLAEEVVVTRRVVPHGEEGDVQIESSIGLRQGLLLSFLVPGVQVVKFGVRIGDNFARVRRVRVKERN